MLKNVTAVKSTLPTGETLLTVENYVDGGSETVSPMGMKIVSLDCGIDLADVYVRLWGKVTSKTNTSAVINDGSGTITVDFSGASPALRVGDFMAVTGHTYGSVIIPRRAADIVVLRDGRMTLRTAAPGPEVTDWSYIFTPNELIAPRGAEGCLRALITAKQYVWAYINDRDWTMNGTQPEGDLVYPNQQIPYDGTAVQLYTANLYKHNVFYVYATKPFAASFFVGDNTVAYTGDNRLWEYSPNFNGGGADPTDPAYTWVPAAYSDAVHTNDTVASYYPADIRYLGAGWYRTTFDIAEEVTAQEAKNAEDGAFVALSEDLIAASDSDALLGNTFFLQNRDRTLGFRGVGANVKRGDVLRNIKAVKSTLPTGETLLTIKNFTAAGTETVSPLGMKIGASGNLTDICVRLWGRVTASDETSVTIDDGSGTAVIDLSKQVTPITHTMSMGDFVSVTGGVCGGTILPTSDADLVTRSGEKSDARTAAAVAESAFGDMSRKIFSFTYDGASSDEFLPTWNRTCSVTTTDDGKVYENLFTDPATGLQLTVKATRYDISPAIEWCMYFKNTSQAKTPIIENILPLDFEAAAASAKLMTSVGNIEGGAIDEYMPTVSDLTSEPTVLIPGNGRSAVGVMPYFDLIFPANTGIITAIGWSGSWKASFAAADGKATLKAGQEQCHFYLKPGEEVRTPAIITLFWSGDRDEGHNAFRRLMLNYCTPHGADINPPASASPYLYNPNSAINVAMGGETEENMLTGINNMLAGGYLPDQWWIDAGWYKCDHWSELGNWYADP
ncbi:MAG: hypothetical protein IJT09_04780, partial [Abditibacteriota bacterium]|nr:hypothetical protein [Abditibacteriota bacterium]